MPNRNGKLNAARLGALRVSTSSIQGSRQPGLQNSTGPRDGEPGIQGTQNPGATPLQSSGFGRAGRAAGLQPSAGINGGGPLRVSKPIAMPKISQPKKR